VSRIKSLSLWGCLVLMLTLCSFLSLPRSGEVKANGVLPPCRFWGTVKVYGEWVPAGTPLTARVEGVSVVKTVQITLMRNNVTGQDESVYSLDFPADNPLTPQKDGGVVGDRVYFEVGYGDGNLTTAESGLWDNTGGFTELNLTVPLRAVLSGLPSGTVSYATADIAVGGGGVVAYKYRLDSGSWSLERPIATPLSLSGLADGPHTLYVIGRNAQGTWQTGAEATTASWTVDTTPPVAKLSGQPTGVVNYSTANIMVGGVGVVSYKYKLDAGPWSSETAVSKLVSLSGLSDGQHVIYVIGKDAVGNWQAETDATEATWIVNTTEPVASLQGQPTGIVNYNTAEIFVLGVDMEAYRWKLDSNPWSEERPMTAPISLSGLSDGYHTIYVISRDTAGNWQEEPTTASWVVDTVPPVAMLFGKPVGTVSSNAADVTVGGSDVVVYKYRLDDGFWSAEVPVEDLIVLSGLSDGRHTLDVIGRDTAGNWQAEANATTASWTVATPEPVATLLNAPTGTVPYDTADITVGGTDVVAYKYRLDDAFWSAEMPVEDLILLSGLSDGRHTLHVIGRNTAGHWQAEANATTATWIVATVRPVAILVNAPTGAVPYNTVDITVGGTDVAAYKYRLDDGLWSTEMPAENPILASGLSDGAHTLYVVGRNDIGSWQAEVDATVVSWVVDTTPPSLPILASPASRAKVKNSPVSLRWSPVDDASGVRYDLQVSSSSDFRLLWVAVEGQDSNSYSTTVLEDGTYYWRVRAVDGVGNHSGWSESRSFRLGGDGRGWWWLALVIGLAGIAALGAIFWWRRQSTRI